MNIYIILYIICIILNSIAICICRPKLKIRKNYILAHINTYHLVVSNRFKSLKFRKPFEALICKF